MADHEHQWAEGQAQKLALPATWYWIKGCTCGAVLMEPVPKDMHLVFEKMQELDRNRTFQGMVRR